ncbi:MAG: aquaporin family protein [Phycisphaerae bacterium]|nr:aquaporin family protein [Phycisphaerae bacterium]
MTPFVGEFVGTAILVMLGNSAQANANLARTRGEGSTGAAGSWMLVATGWGLALFAALAVVGGAWGPDGSQLNPALTLALWWNESIGDATAAWRIAGQLLGAAIGAIAVFLLFLPHWGRTDDPSRKLACFACTPAVRAPISNLVGEAVGSFVFVLAVLLLREVAITPAAGSVPSSMQAVASIDVRMGALAALGPALVLWALALGVGGVTGVGFNPARDLSPRIVHAILPIRGKGSSEWGYAWIPILGPLLGGIAAASLAPLLQA